MKTLQGAITVGCLCLSAACGWAGLPAYPIIFVHGLGDSSLSWTLSGGGHYGVVEFLQTNCDWGSARTIHFCLNQNGGTAIFGSDGLPDYPGTYHDDDVRYWGDDLVSANLYLVNFDMNRAGDAFTPINVSDESESNASAIVKQGYALGVAIRKVLDASGAQKVILVGHSMGGLAIREYLQRRLPNGTHPWWASLPSDGGPTHHVAKMVTVGTPHGGALLAVLAQLSLPFGGSHSEACRDLLQSDHPDPVQRKEGIYLYGGSETNIDTSGLSFWLNADVTCNGGSGDWVGPTSLYLPLNKAIGMLGDNPDMPLPSDVEVFYVMGTALAGVGDGIVAASNAYLPGATVYDEWKSISAWHTRIVTPSGGTALLDDHETLIEALDEPDGPSKAYGLEPQKVIDGFITQQGDGQTGYDSDAYKLVLPAQVYATISVSNVYGDSNWLQLNDYSSGRVISTKSLSSGSGTISGTLEAGSYDVRVAGYAKAEGYLHPYHLLADVYPYLKSWQVLDDGVVITNSATLQPRPDRVVHVVGEIAGNSSHLDRVEVLFDGVVVASGTQMTFDFPVAIPNLVTGSVSIVIAVHDDSSNEHVDYLQFNIGTPDEAIYLDAWPRLGAKGSYQDIAVYVDSRTKPLGAVAFGITLDPPTNVLQFAGVDATWGEGSGGLQPMDNPATYRSGVNMPVIAINSSRPDVFRGDRRAFTLRFLVKGNPGEVCKISLTNVQVVTTAAATSSVDGQPTAPFSVAVKGGVFVVDDDPRCKAWLADVPSVFERHHIYPLRLVIDSHGNQVSAFDVSLNVSPSIFRLLEVTCNRREFSLTVQTNLLSSGSLRLIGVNTDSLNEPKGVFDAATVWLDVLEYAPPGSVATLQVRANEVYARPGMLLGCLQPQQAWGQDFLLSYPLDAAPVITAVSTNELTTNAVFSTYLRIDAVAWAPVMVRGTLNYNPQQLRILQATNTGAFAGGTLTIDTNTFSSGLTDFIVSNLENGAIHTNSAEVLKVSWCVVGPVGQSGNAAFEIWDAADGVENGINTFWALDQGSFAYAIVGPPGDMDGDGLPDWWELAYFGNRTNAVPHQDVDADGQSNWQEFKAGTNPTNPASVFELVNAPLTNDPRIISFQWPSAVNRKYAVFLSTNLLAGFSVLQSNVLATPPFNILTDTNKSAGGHYYRVMIQ